mmetsp:Transcript_74641/g.230714  ORF Transcript_74641/g.230714 Transcript_74641/m.230714 type:complete len:248 (-) Transcript_74641:60-803(-)
MRFQHVVRQWRRHLARLLHDDPHDRQGHHSIDKEESAVLEQQVHLDEQVRDLPQVVLREIDHGLYKHEGLLAHELLRRPRPLLRREAQMVEGIGGVQCIDQVEGRPPLHHHAEFPDAVLRDGLADHSAQVPAEPSREHDVEFVHVHLLDGLALLCEEPEVHKADHVRQDRARHECRTKQPCSSLCRFLVKYRPDDLVTLAPPCRPLRSLSARAFASSPSGPLSCSRQLCRLDVLRRLGRLEGELPLR